MNLKVLKRLIHWGPILGLTIVFFVIIVTARYTSVWFFDTVTFWNVLNASVYFGLAVLILYNYLRAVFVGPGHVPLEWHPTHSVDEEYLQYCGTCNGFKAPRSHHCSKCGRCVLKMDHHCPWLNNCVGHKNQLNFVFFLFFAIVGCVHSVVLHSVKIYQIFRWMPYYSPSIAAASAGFTFFSFLLCLLCISVSVGVSLSLFLLLYFQWKTIISNKTAIEEWIIEKAHERRCIDPTLPPFVYPYDLGKIRNIRQVFTVRHLNDGINWPVVEGCSQYYLTLEQKEQKVLKKMRTAPFKVMYSYSGSCFPISFGFCTCVHPPCSLENRLPLSPDEIVLVTRSRTYWLFGEKCASRVQSKCKGWFPRSSVVPYSEHCSNWLLTKENFCYETETWNPNICKKNS